MTRVAWDQLGWTKTRANELATFVRASRSWSHLLVRVLQGLVQLLQAVLVELLLELLRLSQVLQHLLGEAVGEAGADVLDDGIFQPHLGLAQQAVP